MGYTVGKIMADRNILVKNVTTDGDAASSVGIEMAMKEFMRDTWETRRLADPIHRGQNQFKRGLNALFSNEMFSGAISTERKEVQRAFMIDVKERSHGIFKAMYEKYNGNLEQIKSKLVQTVDKVVNCYAGRCNDNNCRWGVTLCGGGKYTSWWAKSIMLSSYKLKKGSITMTDEDRDLLTNIIEMKLSVAAVKEMPYNSSTNKCEAVNHAISASLPKNRNFGRNGRARTCAAVLRANNNIQVAMSKTPEAVGAPLHKNSLSASALKKMKIEDEYDSNRHKCANGRAKRANYRRIQATEYVESKRQRLCTDYSKDHLEPKLPRKKKPLGSGDHTYNKR